MIKFLPLILLTLLGGCRPLHQQEFELLAHQLSGHFDYTVKQSEQRQVMNCRKIIFSVEGKARGDLRLRRHKKAFLYIPSSPPSTLDESGLRRWKEKQINELRTSGIKEHCLEVVDFECRKYSFRNVTEKDLIGLVQEIESEYSVNLKRGETITNKIQMKLCPQKEMEVSYFMQLP